MDAAVKLPLASEEAVSQSDETQVVSERRLPFSFAKRHGVLVAPKDNHDTKVVQVMYRNHLSPVILAEVRRFVGQPIEINRLESDAFEEFLTQAYQNDSTEAMQMVEDLGDEMDLTSLADSLPETEDLLEQEDDAPIIRLINAILSESVKQNASDVHIETFEKDLIVRFRVDGMLREMVRPKRALASLLVSRIKVMARLDIAEKRVPQDGRISLRVAGREVDLRVSTMPSNYGERVVLRLLDKQAGRLNLSHLGMATRDHEVMQDLIIKPHGILLVTGPTGSGKTTTLYASLAQLTGRQLNIMTVEDPIEYNLQGINQTQVNVKADMTFARGLRAMLRQDPDVVMVGEIRDIETAEIAVQASLTGHLVLSTLHTNTAIGAVTRLNDMGVEPFLLSSSLIGLLAQRLVRVLCGDCKEPYQATDLECKFLGIDGKDRPTLYHPKGCANCNQLGFRGRTGIYELVAVDGTLRNMIHNNSSEQELSDYARTKGPGIRDDGRRKVLEGVTTMEEVLLVTRED